MKCLKLRALRRAEGGTWGAAVGAEYGGSTENDSSITSRCDGLRPGAHSWSPADDLWYGASFQPCRFLRRIYRRDGSWRECFSFSPCDSGRHSGLPSRRVIALACCETRTDLSPLGPSDNLAGQYCHVRGVSPGDGRWRRDHRAPFRVQDVQENAGGLRGTSPGAAVGRNPLRVADFGFGQSDSSASSQV